MSMFLNTFLFLGVVVGDPALCFAETMHYVFLPQLRMKKDWGKCPPEIATQTIANLEKYTQQMYEAIASSGNPTLTSGQQVMQRTFKPHLFFGKVVTNYVIFREFSKLLPVNF